MSLIFEKKVTIVKLSRPMNKDINHSLQWFGNSLGLFSLRDRDKSCFRIFIELLKASKAREPVSSDDIAEKLELTRGTVVHHVNKLMNSGIAVRYSGKYMLRVENLSELVEEVHRDLSNTCKELRDIAEEIDKNL
jgi:predicted transcriptional regulator